MAASVSLASAGLASTYNVRTMSGRRSLYTKAALWLVLILGATGSLRAQAALNITTVALPSAAVGSSVRMRISVTGGAQPLRWKISRGNLPPGLRLNAARGVIAGTPTAPGVYDIEVTVTDSSDPAMQIQREFKLVITAALTIDWKESPEVHGQNLSGSVMVSNLSKQDFTLTVIVMAVNKIGRATALGYQEFTLRSGEEQVIPFGSSPGSGEYVVHADAVAEVASTNTIYRARKQTSNLRVIQAPE